MHPVSALTLAAIASLSLLVAGCGGGSGSDGGNGQPPPPPPPPATGIHFSTTNAAAAAGLASTLAGQVHLLAPVASESRAAFVRNPGRSSVVQSCRFAGTESFELTDRDGNGVVSPNDSIRVTFTSCRSDDSTYDATLDVVYDTIAEQGGETFLAGHIALETFTIATGDGRLVSLAGTAQFEYRFSADRDDFTVRSSSFSMTLVGGTETVRTLEHRAVHDLSSRAYEVTLSGTVDSESLGGDYRFAATALLQGGLGQYPTAGALQLDGAGNSRVRLIEGDPRENSTELTVLLVDANGDGVNETSQVAPWGDYVAVLLFEGLREPAAPPPPPPPPSPEPDVVEVHGRHLALFAGTIRDVQSDPARRRVYLSVRDHIVVLSADTYLIETQFFVGSRPTGLAMSADGSRLYVALSGGGAVSIVDLDTFAVSTVEVATEMAGAYVVDVIEARPGVVLASGLRYEPEVFLVTIDTSDGNRVRRVAGGEVVYGEPTLFASPDGRFVYVGNRASDPPLLKLDALATDLPVVARTDFGAAAAQLAVSTDGTRLITGGGTIYDAETLARISSGFVDGHVAANQDGSQLLRTSDFLLQLDGATFQTLARYRTHCPRSFLQSISAVGLRDEWILNLSSGQLCVISLSNPDTPPGVDGSRALPPLLQAVGVAATEYFIGPRDSVSGMALDATRGFTYVSLPLHREVVAVPLDDAQTDHVIATPGAGQPRRMIMSHDGSRLYVALWGTGEVAVIDPDSRQVERVLGLSTLLGNGNTSDLVEPVPGRLFVSASPDTGERAFVVEVDPADPASARRVGHPDGYRQAFLYASPAHLYIADQWWPTQVEKRALLSPALDLLMTSEPQGSGSTVASGRLSPDDSRLYLQNGIILSTSTLRQVGLAIEGIPRVSADGREVSLGGGNHVLTYRTDTLEWTGSVISGCVTPVFPDYAIDMDVLPDRSRFIILGSGGAVCMMDATPP